MSIILPADDPNTVHVAVEMLRHGKLIVIPTDTGYGLAAELADQAILRLYLLKEQPPAKSIPVLVGSVEDVELVAQPLMPHAKRIAEHFWPGPLTLLLPRVDGLPRRVSDLPTVAVRVPKQGMACAVLHAAGGALAVARASIGQQTPTTAQGVLDLFGKNVGAIIDGGTLEDGRASTIAEVHGRHIRIVRPGQISEDALKAVLQV